MRLWNADRADASPLSTDQGNAPREKVKRLSDNGLGTLLFVAALPPMLVVAGIVRLSSTGPVLYWANRMGRDHQWFRMPKFRTMRTTTPQVPADQLTEPDYWLTPVGEFLRRSSLDELPQLWSVIKGDMSLVGPRPAMDTYHDLIALRTAHGIDCLRPGITGWAQINGRNTLSLEERIVLDRWYLEHYSFWVDLKILTITVWKVLRCEDTKVPRHLLAAAPPRADETRKAA